MAAHPELGSTSTPEQQAALAALDNGWTRDRVIEAIARTGTIEDAAAIAGVGERTIRYWAERDPAFAEQVLAAKRRCGERVFGQSVATVLRMTDEQRVNHPNLIFHVTGVLLPETQRNAGITIDARSVNLTLLEDGQLDRIKKALRASMDEPSSDQIVIDAPE